MTLEQQIERLEQIRNSAATSITVDGVTTNISQDAAAKRLLELNRQLAVANGQPDPRPVAPRIKLT